MIDPVILSLMLAFAQLPPPGEPAKLFRDVKVDLVEQQDLVHELIVTVTGLRDGADEILVIDGTARVSISTGPGFRSWFKRDRSASTSRVP